MSPCHDCGVPVLEATTNGPANLGVRAIGRDGPKGRCVSVLCWRCLFKRGAEAKACADCIAERAGV